MFFMTPIHLIMPVSRRWLIPRILWHYTAEQEPHPFALQGEADGWMAEKMFAKDPARWVFYDEVLIHKNNLK
jgi:hypothetical protein